MAEFKPIKTISSKLNNITKKEGQFIITTDTKKIYYDKDATSRIEFSGGSSVNGIKSITNSLGELTLTKDDNTTSSLDLTNDLVSYGYLDNTPKYKQIGYGTLSSPVIVKDYKNNTFSFSIIDFSNMVPMATPMADNGIGIEFLEACSVKIKYTITNVSLENSSYIHMKKNSSVILNNTTTNKSGTISQSFVTGDKLYFGGSFVGNGRDKGNLKLELIFSTIPRYLATNNTKTYTPSSNYHPATKKYVDDKIRTATGYTWSDVSMISPVNPSSLSRIKFLKFDMKCLVDPMDQIECESLRYTRLFYFSGTYYDKPAIVNFCIPEVSKEDGTYDVYMIYQIFDGSSIAVLDGGTILGDPFVVTYLEMDSASSLYLYSIKPNLNTCVELGLNEFTGGYITTVDNYSSDDKSAPSGYFACLQEVFFQLEPLF